MKRLLFFNWRCLFVFLVAIHFTKPCLSQIKINLNDLTLNDTIPLRNLTLNRVTKMFGRPSATWQYESNGPTVYYHPKGMSFDFSPRNQNPEQKISSLSIYLVKSWDEDPKEFYLPFTGTIIPNISSDIQMEDILTLFKDYSKTIKSAEQAQKESLELTVKYNVNVIQENPEHQIKVENNGNYINFFCEKVTKFLDRIVISFKN